jgi:hypothetical protein
VVELYCRNGIKLYFRNGIKLYCRNGILKYNINIPLDLISIPLFFSTPRVFGGSKKIG